VTSDSSEPDASGCRPLSGSTRLGCELRNGHQVIDADGHVIEPFDLWDRYLDPEFRGISPICDPNSTSIEVLGYKMPRSYGAESYRKALTTMWDEKYAVPKARGYDAQSHLDSMDVEGIDVMVLFPSRGLYAAAIEHMDGRIASAICRAYNRWLADFCSANPSRLVGVALTSLHDPDRAAEDVTWAVSELGMRGVVVRPNPYEGRNMHDPAYDNFYSALEELDVPLCTHEGNGAFMPQYGPDRFSERIAWHVMCHPMEQMGAVVSLTAGGVFERHPRLKVAILECGAGWLPYWLYRLDEHVEWLKDSEAKDLSMLPSEYFQRQGWISLEPDEPDLPAIIKGVGQDKLLWASDYPHPDASYPGMVDELFSGEGLTDDDLRHIACENPIALFGLTVPATAGAS
jgi:predicted TIM-barrel fold metal-dependent hydrolase